MDDDDPTGHLARVTARIARDQTGEVVVGLGNRTETYLAGSARGETFEIGESVVIVTVTAGRHVLVTAFS
jgi:hypothetical protein